MAKRWLKIQRWMVGKLTDTEGALVPINSEDMQPPPKPEKDYQTFLENASRLMIRFKKPEHLIKMITAVINDQLGINHTAVLLHKEQKGAFVLIDSKGESGIKLPIGFIRMSFDNPLIKMFSERKNYMISQSGVLNYKELTTLLKNNSAISKYKGLTERIELVLKEMDLLKSTLCIPLYNRKTLIGVLILGEKKSKEKFTRQEIGFFMTLANDTAMAIANAQLIQSLQEKVDEVQFSYDREHRIFIHTAIALAAAIDARDPYTHGHTERVTHYCFTVAEELKGVPEARSYKSFGETLHISALLHDVGKIGIPDSVLNKRKNLTRKEFSLIKKHPEIGAAILTPIKELNDVAREILYHQEYYDGTGYPEGLKGHKIPFIARIIAVCDAFDAMTTTRPYRRKKGAKTAMQEIRSRSGTQFDPIVVSAFMLAWEKGKIPKF